MSATQDALVTHYSERTPEQERMAERHAEEQQARKDQRIADALNDLECVTDAVAELSDEMAPGVADSVAVVYRDNDFDGCVGVIAALRRIAGRA